MAMIRLVPTLRYFSLMDFSPVTIVKFFRPPLVLPAVQQRLVGQLCTKWIPDGGSSRPPRQIGALRTQSDPSPPVPSSRPRCLPLPLPNLRSHSRRQCQSYWTIKTSDHENFRKYWIKFHLCPASQPHRYVAVLVIATLLHCPRCGNQTPDCADFLAECPLSCIISNTKENIVDRGSGRKCTFPTQKHA